MFNPALSGDEAWLEVVLDGIRNTEGLAEHRGDTHISGHHRSHRKHHQRNRHRPGRFARTVPGMMSVVVGIVMTSIVVPVGISVLPGWSPILTVKGHIDQAKHVERRHPGGDGPDHPQDWVAHEGEREDLVLAEESGEQRNAGNGQCANEHRQVGDRHIFPETTHPGHVLLMVHGMNDRPAAQEEQRLEEGMGHQVKGRGPECADARRQEHVAQLRDRRVGQNLLDVGLHQTDRGRDERRQCPHHGDHHHHRRSVAEEHRVPTHHVDAGRDHRRRVDQGGYRCRTLHRVWQPDMKRDLSALSGRPHEQQ